MVAAMPPWWPLLPAGIAMLADGLVAEAGNGPVGLVAVDMTGSIPLILVHPACQGRGVGAGLLAAALDTLRAGTAAGSAPPWSPRPRGSCLRPAPGLAISAGPPARPSTAVLATSPGVDTPCSTAPPNHALQHPLMAAREARSSKRRSQVAPDRCRAGSCPARLVGRAALAPDQARDRPERSDRENRDAEVHRDRCDREQPRAVPADALGWGFAGGRPRYRSRPPAW
jgi:hypothetical protein